MKKYISFLVLCILLICTLTACGGRAATLTKQNNENYRYVKQLVNIMTENNSDKLYDMFAQNVKDETPDLKGNIEELCNQINGEFVDCKNEGGSESEGKHHYSCNYIYRVTTTEGEYCIKIVRKAEYEDSSVNGLVTIGLQDANDFDNDPCLPADIPGVYVVYEDNHQDIWAKEDEVLGVNDIVCQVNEETFPDEVLRNYILQEVDTDKADGQLSVYEVNRADEIMLDGTEAEPTALENLKGIEYLSGLEILRIDYSNVSEIDVSKNEALEVLAIEHTNISKVDLSNNPNMRIVECDPDVEVIGYDGSVSQLYD